MVKDVPVAEASDAEPANSPKASRYIHSFKAQDFQYFAQNLAREGTVLLQAPYQAIQN